MGKVRVAILHTQTERNVPILIHKEAVVKIEVTRNVRVCILQKYFLYCNDFALFQFLADLVT